MEAIEIEMSLGPDNEPFKAICLPRTLMIDPLPGELYTVSERLGQMVGHFLFWERKSPLFLRRKTTGRGTIIWLDGDEYNLTERGGALHLGREIYRQIVKRGNNEVIIERKT